jgi:hypothetical protein
MVPIKNPKVYHLAGDLYPDPLLVPPGAKFHSPLTSVGLPDIKTTCISASYLHPQLPSPDFEFKADLLPGVKMPPRALNQDDVQRVKFGRGGYNNRGGNDRGGHNRGGNDRGGHNRGGYRGDRGGYRGRGSPNLRDQGRGEGYYSDRSGYRNDRGGFHQTHHIAPQYPHGLYQSTYNQRDPYQHPGFAQSFPTAQWGGYPIPPPIPPGWNAGPSIPPAGVPWHTNPVWQTPNQPAPPNLPPRPNLAWNRNVSNQR